MTNNDTMSNAKHTPEPWKPPKAGHTYLSVSMSGADYERARLCVNKCAGIQDLSSAVLVPVEALKAAREVLDKAIVEVASTGAPFLNGRYHKDGEWSFSEMTERNNPADAAAIKKGFLLMQDALRLLAALGGES